LAESAQTFGISNSVFLEILRGDIENINNITNGVSNELFEKAVEKLSSAKSIYLLGLRSSYSLAFYLAFNLRFFLKSEIPTYIESFTAPMSLLNALITAVALKKKKQALPALKRLETEFEEFGTYVNKM
jgi:DNA-binding MurR/RpiR family transcriptional regulator